MRLKHVSLAIAGIAAAAISLSVAAQKKYGTGASRDWRKGNFDAARDGGPRRRKRSVPGGGKVGALNDENRPLGNFGSRAIFTSSAATSCNSPLAGSKK